MKMRIFKYYPLWKINELEDFLSKSEFEGWRLSYIKFSCIFYFVKCKSKDSDYIITYNMAKDRTFCMYQYEQELMSDYCANRIATKATGFSAFRITGQNRNFKDLKQYRNKYFKHVMFQYMLISLIFLITGLMLMIASIHHNISGYGYIVTGSYFFFTLALFIYRIYGYVKQAKLCSED